VKKRPKCYQPLERQSEELSFIVGGFDTETEGLNGKILCATWFVQGMFEAELILGTPKEIAGALLDVFASFGKSGRVRWFAHNAQYDWRYLIDEILERYEDSVEFLMRTDDDVFVIKTKDFELVDSFALWPHSLKSLAEKFTPDLLKLDIGDEIAHFDVSNPKHIEYAKRDAEVLVKALIKFDETIFALFKTHIAYTLPATGIKAWRATIEQAYFASGRIDDFVREAYFGGAVLGRFGKEVYEDVLTFDINSSYPYSMREFGVPYGSYARSSEIIKDKPGIYRVLIKTPDDLVFPIIPKRIVKGESNFIVWPQGIFETVCTNIELEFAVKQGYEVLEVRDGLVWNQIVYPFEDFVNYCEEARKTYKGTALEMVIKLVQNSVYGKFGTKLMRTKLFVPKKDEDYIGAAPWGMSEKLWIKKEADPSIMALPQWAVFITANARIHLLTHIYRLGVDNVIYCDTDSITTTKEIDLKYVGEKYGQFKLEKRWREFTAGAPKVYSGRLDNGKLSGAVKGIPKRLITDSDYQDLIDGKIIEKTSTVIPSFKTYIKGDRENKEMTRHSTDIVNSKSWSEIDGRIHPVTIYEEEAS